MRIRKAESRSRKFLQKIFAENKNLHIFASASDEATSIGAVVQLVRMPACHAGGRGFESLPHRHKMPLTHVRGIFSKILSPKCTENVLFLGLIIW